MSALEIFVAAVVPRLPGYLSACDLVASKRRNLHVGKQQVDQDIELFDRLLRQQLGAGAVVASPGGDDWLAYTTYDPGLRLRQLLGAYTVRQTHGAGWHGVATPPSGPARQRSVQATIQLVRTARCSYGAIADAAALDALIATLLDSIPGFPPGVVTRYPAAEPVIASQPTLEVITGTIPGDLTCPACGGDRFDWTDRSENAAHGTCQTCKAACEFQFF